MHPHKQPSPFSLACIRGLKVIDEPSAGLVRLANDGESVDIRALENGIFEITFKRGESQHTHFAPSLAGIPQAVKRDVTTDTIGDCSDALRIRGTDGASLCVALDSFALGLSLESQGTTGASSTIELLTLDRTQRNGFNGEKFGLGFRMPDRTPYYGFGEKTRSLNKHGEHLKFWNLDVCADLPDGFMTDHYDPTYCSIPVAIWPVTDSKSGATAYAAVLIDNLGPTWFNLQSNDFGEPDLFYFGTYAGEPRFYFITGASMGAVCAKLSRLTGRPKLPPLWSLANQQCRWGYDEERMYKGIINTYEEHEIPLHGFWLDIDYMTEYQVFTWHEDRVPSPERLSEWMNERGVRMVTIVDPGVPVREDNDTYLDGIEKDVFCRAPSGEHFVGMVWPGKTVFPDYSMPEVREWWGALVAGHLARGVDGIWNDMNDPAAGMSDVNDMLFHRGEIAHVHYHNLYGTFMAEATWLGFRQHDKKARPFILTRSASTGIQQFAAVWTGDNVSSWAHLRMSIPETLNLALSGVSFNGADIGGFMESTTAELLTRWYQASVLFPFYRNHSNNGTAHQEPWCFGSGTRDVIRDVINLRYRFLGAIYTEFARHIQTGEPMVRPLCYFSADDVYRDVADQYALGDSIVVAPMVEEGAHKRYVVLPPGRWFDLTKCTWHDGGVIFERECSIMDVPIFAKSGSIIAEPVPQSGSFVGWDCDLTKVNWRLHVFVESAHEQAYGSQLIDDGRTYVEGAPALIEIAYEDGVLSGSFPFDRVVEVTINGGDAMNRHESIGSSTNGNSWSAESDASTRSVLQPQPISGKSADRCVTYSR